MRLFCLLLLFITGNAFATTLKELQNAFSMPHVSTGVCDNVAYTAISDGTNSLAFFLGLRKVVYNGNTIWINEPSDPDPEKKTFIRNEDYRKFLLPIITPGKITNNIHRVFIDAGHGGDDGGCSSPFRSLHEKDLVLDLSLRVGELLKDEGLEVFYSRKDDKFVSLTDRGNLAEKCKADIFVAIHANSAGSKSARGSETYIMPLANFQSTAAESRISKNAYPGNKFDSLSASLGYSIHKYFPGHLGYTDRGLRHARYQVLRQAEYPAVLLECGFLSNDDDSRNLASNWYRDRLAERFATGIMEFIRKHASEPMGN